MKAYQFDSNVQIYSLKVAKLSEFSNTCRVTENHSVLLLTPPQISI